ncbi:hypothetical protein DPMN_176463 [Dreissena polymorpha]|uniref:C2H2-type domain-containing protein n=1 Tax=Dreissena polymorpha TaxID=45954 RepID=A0A9D4EBC2_DREPO|nr:hypothetical protein DPMN_176463 [Dreissena polymorpha]
MMKGTETPLSDNSISVQADLDNTVDTDQSTDITAFLGRNFNLGKTVKETCNIESVKKKVHRCKECGEAFSREAALKKHLLEHETGEENDMFKQEMDADETDLQMANYACAECKNTYSTSLGLIHHNRIKHAGANEQELLAHIQGTDRLRKIAEDSAIVKTPVKSKKRKRSLQGSSNSQEQACKREKLDEKGLKMYECLYCPSSFKTFQAAMNHEKDSHPYKSANKPEIGCPTTPQYSKTGRLITKSRKLIERFNCPHCPKSFDLEKSLNSHITVQHFVKEEKDNALKSPTKQVQSKQGNVKLDGYKCQKCDKVFEQIINLRRHQMMKHKEKWDDTDVKLEAAESEIPTASGSMIYDCDVCKEKFSVLSAVQQHMKAVHDENDTPIVKSEMKSNKKRKLKATHLKTEGNGGGCGEDSGQIHRCAECYKSFKWKKNLSSHMRSFHSEANTKTKTCGICNKVFPNEHSIEEHMKTHDTTFDCAHCSKHFTSELSLKSHETQMHKNVRESLLVCNICTEKFTSKAKLLQHMLTHTSLMGKSTPDKPEPEKELRFSCKKCGKKFLNPWQIRLHNAKVHSMAAFSKVSKVRTIGNVKTRRQSADSISSVETRSKIKKAVLASKIKKAVAASKTTLLKKRKSTLTDVKIRKTGLPPKLSPKLSTAKTLPKSLGPPKLRLGPASYKAKFGASKQSPKPAASATLKMKLGPASYKAKFEASKQSPKPTASATLTPKIAKSAESKKDEPAASIPPVTCNICQKEFKKRRYLNKHMKNVHKVNKELNSMNVHKGNKELKSMKRVKCLYCRECHQMFWTMEQFEVHVKTQHPDRAALELDKQVMQRLVKTEMASPNRAGSLSALEDDDSGVPVQYKCEFCNTIMWTKQSFEDHIIKYHPDHVDEYGINEDVLTESKPQIELVDDRHDPTNFLNIELYNDITCDKLSTQPVVKIKKMTDTLTKSSVDVDPDVNDENLEEPYYSESKCPQINDGNEQHMETEEVLDVDINKSNEDKNENINDKMQGDVDEIQKRAMESESVDYLDYVRDKDNVDKSLASIGDKDDDTEGQTIEEVDHEKKFKEIQATGSASLGRNVSYMVTEQHKPVADVTTNLHSTLLEQAYREPSNETEQHTPVVDSTTDLHNTSFEQACKAPSYETEQHTPVEDSTTDLRSTSLEQAFRKPSNETEQHTPVEDSTTDLHRTSLEQAYREPSNETEQHTSVEDSTTDLHSTSLEQAFSQPERGGLLQNTDSNELVPNKENYKYVQNMESNGYFFVEGSSSEGMFNVTSPSRNNVEGYTSTEEYIEQLKPSLESAASSNDIQSSPENIVMKNEDHLDLAENTSFSDQANDVSEIQLVNYKKMSSVTESIQRAEQAEPGQASTTDQLEEYVKYNNIAQQPDAISADNITKTQSFEESVEETVSSTHDWNTEEYLSNIKEVGYSTYASEDLGTNETAFAMQQVVSYADQDIVGNHVQFTSKTDAILGSEPMETE